MNHWLILIINGIGLVVYPIVFFLIWRQKKDLHRILWLTPLFAMLFGVFITEWQGRSIVGVWAFVAGVSAVTMLVSTGWLIRCQRLKKETDDPLRALGAIVIAAMILFSAILHFLSS